MQKSQTQKLNHFREVRAQLKKAAADKRQSKDKVILRREMEKQRAINEEITRTKIQEQTELNAMVEKKFQQGGRMA